MTMAASAERIFEFLNEEEEQQTVENPAIVRTAINGQRFVRACPVWLQARKSHLVIHDFNCGRASRDRMVAIVGPTGAGKTTMVKLLMRFYDVNSGAIRLNGHDIRDFNRSDLREGFGMVLQDTWLFKGTIMENIRYGRLDATDEEVIAAAKAARADRFIRTLPGGYQMELNEEASNVSQGQKQLLTIARAILADNPILILDEATSSVDTRTEQLIQDAMAHLMQGRTSFVIAHRLSTIRDADLILVMKDGDIIEQGDASATVWSRTAFMPDCTSRSLRMRAEQLRVFGEAGCRNAAGFINCLQKHADLLYFTRIWYATINTIQKKFV